MRTTSEIRECPLSIRSEKLASSFIPAMMTMLNELTDSVRPVGGGNGGIGETSAEVLGYAPSVAWRTGMVAWPPG